MTADLDLERVREAYPDAGESSSERLASLRAGLLDAIEDCGPSRPGGRYPRHPGLPRRRLLLGVAALATVAGVALLLTGPGRSTPHQATATEARAVLRGAAAGLAVPAGAVLHVEDTSVQTFADRPAWSTSREQIWQETSYPFDVRIISDDRFSFTHPTSQEWAVVDNVMQLYDPQRDVIYTNPPLPFTVRPAARAGRYLLTPTHDPAAPTITITARELRALRDRQDTIVYDTRHHVSVVSYRAVSPKHSFLDSVRNAALTLLHSGHAQVRLDTRFAGGAAIEISGPGPIPVIRQEIYYVAPRTYQPLGLVERWAGKSRETWATRFTTYRRLPGTVANRALVTLPGAHPRAAIDTSPADYTAASSRLGN